MTCQGINFIFSNNSNLLAIYKNYSLSLEKDLILSSFFFLLQILYKQEYVDSAEYLRQNSATGFLPDLSIYFSDISNVSFRTDRGMKDLGRNKKKHCLLLVKYEVHFSLPCSRVAIAAPVSKFLWHIIFVVQVNNKVEG